VRILRRGGRRREKDENQTMQDGIVGREKKPCQIAARSDMSLIVTKEPVLVQA
jgi:hypothetical protein